MSYRVSFVFDQPSEKSSGWTSSFYNNASDLPATRTRADKLGGVLTAILGVQTTLKFIRIAKCPHTRNAISYRWEGTPGLASSKDGAVDSDVPQTALLVQMRTADLLGHSSFAMRGIPDDWTTTGGLFKGAAGSADKITALKNVLKDTNQGWIIRYLTPTRPVKPIKAFSALGVVTTQGNLGVLDDDYVIVARVTGMPSQRRQFKAINVSGNSFELFPWPANVPAPDIDAVSTVSIARYTETSISTVEANTGTTHKVGRPPRLASGRRKIRAT